MLQHRAVTENYLRQQKIQNHCSIRETSPVSSVWDQISLRCGPAEGCVCAFSWLDKANWSTALAWTPAAQTSIAVTTHAALTESHWMRVTPLFVKIKVRALNVEACQMWKLRNAKIAKHNQPCSFSLSSVNKPTAACSPPSTNDRRTHHTERSGRREM